MPEYQHDFDDDLWDGWKQTVDRDKPLWKRLEELMQADVDGRVIDEGDPVEPDIEVAEQDEPIEIDRDVVEHADVSTDEGVREEAEKLLEGDTDSIPDALEAVDFPGTKHRAECVEAVEATYDYIRENGGATMRELVTDVMPEHDVGYKVPVLKEGERYRGGWWRHVVKPGLEALPDVEKPPRGGSTWRWSP